MSSRTDKHSLDPVPRTSTYQLIPSDSAPHANPLRRHLCALVAISYPPPIASIGTKRGVASKWRVICAD